MAGKQPEGETDRKQPEDETDTRMKPIMNFQPNLDKTNTGFTISHIAP